jgi:hypothetical protein
MSEELDGARVNIQVRPNGSLRVTGTVDFVDAEGVVIRTDTNFFSMPMWALER